MSLSTTAGATADLAKLTVPQLKALCKERRIVGYSKLGKAALLQKLTLTGVTIQHNDAAHNLQLGLPIQAISESRAPEAPEPAAGHPKVPTSAKRLAQLNPLSVLSPADLDTPSQSSAVDCQSSLAPVAGKSHGTKRPCISAVVESAKKQKSSPVNAVPIHHDPNSAKPSLPSAGTLTVHAVIPVTESPHPAVGRLLHRSGNSNVVLINTPRIQNESLATRHGRFKPLILANTPVVANAPVNSRKVAFNGRAADEIPCIFSGIFSLEAAPFSTPSFVNITLPPKLSDRKRVQRWAIMLSALSDEDRQNCALVSRAFRYAVYLSASHILARKYHGRRSDELMKRYPQNMMNMWPYLRQRRDEVAFWRRVFQNSFVGRYSSAFGIEPLSARLWTSPDDEKQVIVALRFVLTRFWFTLSVGTNVRDPLAWLKHTVEDAQEVVKGEIWTITIRDGNSLSVVYILESTCEVIGRARDGPQLEVYSSGLRSDWSEYILSHAGASAESRSLILEHLRWANYEEYDRGVSRHWLHRVLGEGDVGLSKKVVAARYVMACVVANSVSGQWMSSHGMAQEFAGLPSKAAIDTTQGRTPKVNLYVPAHHHVESVHFTTPKGVPLHPALAVVQTPAREYIVLKDNGMQVGCEEEGVANVWMHVLGCDKSGIAVVCSE